ncbi:TIM barrel protein [Microbacterium luteolum]|uniref:Sugar phosphate isomerase/epimerase n=1 Tax=Microbacterium luteolum TaxID=69367 RepID=A0ABY7XQU5_MICLT|nr:TIM barrel protein [Microbacterium luteolum]WDM44489.1 sugar phosphate isomerase/epimerase [Microbacterium luteolum]
MIGLGTYAYFWQHSDRAPEPLSLIGAFEDTRAQGVDLFQICDYAPLERMSDDEVRDAAAAARDLGLTIELGTKGIVPAHLSRFLELAAIFDARLVRSMLYGPDSRPTLDEAETWLRDSIRSYEAAGVTLALETYEQVPTAELVGIIERVGSPNLGICLDPANVVAQLENPKTCVELTAALTKNIHVKDFAFARQPGWVGFTYSGAAMGTGLHDYAQLLAAVQPRERGINEIVEHWLPWQDDAETTIRTEREWTRTALDYLRSTTS